MHCSPPLRMEGEPGSCQLLLMLLYEVVRDEATASLLPINTLRNAALMSATSPLVAMIDVDLLLSSSLAAELQDEARWVMGAHKGFGGFRG